MIYLNPCVQKSKKRSDGSYVGYICLTRERQMYMYNTGIILKSNHDDEKIQHEKRPVGI